MKKFLDKIVYPIIAIVLANILLLLLGEVRDNNWQSLYKKIPNWLLCAVFGVLFIWLVVALIRTRFKKLYKKSGFRSTIVYTNGYEELGNLDYKGVIWKIMHPKDIWGKINLDKDKIEINSTPYCPNCEEMELMERKNFLGRYVWSCIKCGFKKRNGKSAYDISKNNVLKIAKSEIVKQFIKNQD